VLRKQLKNYSQMKKILTSLFNPKPNPYVMYKEHCRVVKAILTADPGFVSTNARHDHIVQQRAILSGMLD
jgi:hypothetical protein